jgi:transposase
MSLDSLRTPRLGEGRPTALTPEVHALFVKYLRLGNYIEVAAALVGVGRSTVFEWLRRGAREESGIYRDFLMAARQAQGEAEATDLARIQAAAGKDWRASAWRLQHRFPSRWAATSEDGDADIACAPEPAVASECDLTDDDYAEAAAFLLRRKRARVTAARAAVGELSVD